MFHGFVDEAERWKIRWALVDDKTERLLHTLHATNRDLYPAIYSIISILVTMPVSSAINERYFSGIRRVKSYLRSTIGDEWLSNLSLMHVYTDMCKSTLISILMTFLAEGIGAFTFHKLIQVGGKWASVGFVPWFPYQGSALEPLDAFSDPSPKCYISVFIWPYMFL